MTLSAVRAALQASLTASIPALQWYAFPPGAPNPPCGIITPSPGAFLTYQTSVVSHDLELTIGILAQWGDDESAFALIDSLIADSGTNSLYAALGADPTLGGVVDDTNLMDAADYGRVEYADGTPYLGCTFRVSVLL